MKAMFQADLSTQQAAQTVFLFSYVPLSLSLSLCLSRHHLISSHHITSHHISPIIVISPPPPSPTSKRHAISRMIVGCNVDRVSQKILWSIAIVVQIGALIILGCLVWYPVSEIAFICALTLLGFSLSASKVLTITSVRALFGGVNFKKGFGLMCVPFGIAAMLGPVTI
jgi:hypothetical protein